MQVVGVLRVGAVVPPPRVLVDVRADAHHLRDHAWVADRVRTRAVVAGRDEHLDVVVLDQAVVEDPAGVVAVVQRRQTADAHVDDVHVVRLDQVDHSLGQRVRGAACGEEAGANHGDLRPWSRAAHPAAEQAVAGGNARDMRSVGAGDDADADKRFRRDRSAQRTEPTRSRASPGCRARSGRCRS